MPRIVEQLARVAVVGAGPSGLASARWLAHAGFEPVVLERSESPGGVWRFDAALQDGGGPAYRSLRTNTPRDATAFSDFPFDSKLPEFPSRAAVTDYLQRYAEHFDVLRRIRFNTRVETLTPDGDGGWLVRSAGPQGAVEERCAAAFVCSGMYDVPRLPQMPGLESFRGPVLHSRSFRDAEPFTGQRVLVVGTGSSGVDIAAEAGATAQRVWLSGRSVDWRTVDAEADASPAWRARLARHIKLRLGYRFADIGDAPFVPHPDRTKMSMSLREQVAAGHVLPSPRVERIDGNTAVFVDGSRAEVDAIIVATGYDLRFAFLSEAIVSAPPAGLGLYRTVVHPDYPTLFFIGMSRATGPIPPLGEMQARWATQVLCGNVQLPPPAAMHDAITRRREHVARVGGNPYRLQYEPFMDLLAAELGALPRLWRHPRLLRRLLAGPFLAARFRLDGPGRDPEAARYLWSAGEAGRQGDRETGRQGDKEAGRGSA